MRFLQLLLLLLLDLNYWLRCDRILPIQRADTSADPCVVVLPGRSQTRGGSRPRGRRRHDLLLLLSRCLLLSMRQLTWLIIDIEVLILNRLLGIKWYSRRVAAVGRLLVSTTDAAIRSLLGHRLAVPLVHGLPHRLLVPFCDGGRLRHLLGRAGPAGLVRGGGGDVGRWRRGGLRRRRLLSLRLITHVVLLLELGDYSFLYVAEMSMLEARELDQLL